MEQEDEKNTAPMPDILVPRETNGSTETIVTENVCGCRDEHKRHSRQASNVSVHSNDVEFLGLNDMLSIASSRDNVDCDYQDAGGNTLRQRNVGTTSNDFNSDTSYADDDESGHMDLAGLCFPKMAEAKEQAEQFMKRATHFCSLPPWLQDNEFLHFGHRPQLDSFGACFGSIFRIHTETGNIWTHLLGCIVFLALLAYYIVRHDIQWQEKIVFSTFFAGAVACMGMSCAFHTVSCHSARVGLIFSKLDYCGISLLIIGSFVPWLFYGFYCRYAPKIVYISMIVALGTIVVIVSLWDKFGEPAYRPLRAGLFAALGLSGVIPCVHYFITDGFWSAITEASLGWLLLMGALYLIGATIYACRIPERFFPGKFDIWIHSHQIWHLFVIAAAFVHYKGISDMALYRLSSDSCQQNFDNLLKHT